MARHLQQRGADNFDYWARCKRAAVLWDWMNGIPVEEIEKSYTISPFQGKLSHGNIRKFADSTRWCLRSVHEIVALMFPDRAPQLAEIELVARSLEIGIPRNALDLLSVPVLLARGEYLALWAAGIATLGQVNKSSRDRIAEILGKSRAREICPTFQREEQEKGG